MHVVVAGGTGLVGKNVAALLKKEGHEVSILSRSGNVTWDTVSPCPPEVAQADAIVNLAGASIGGRRWNKAYKEEMVRSRVETTQWLAKANPKAKWVQASAIGFYGRNPEGICKEGRGPGDDYLANLAAKWEQAAPSHATVLRFGHVLAHQEGMLARLRPIYNLRLGGPIAGGEQGLPWVHVQDVARAIAWALQHGHSGPYNLVSPKSGSQRDFNEGMSRAMRVFAKIPMPGFLLRMVVGELADYLIGGQRAPPSRIRAEGFRFEYPELSMALAEIFDPRQHVTVSGTVPRG